MLMSNAPVDPPARRTRIDLRRAVLAAVLVLIGMCVVAVAAGLGVWLSRRTPTEVAFGVALVWLLALTILFIVHDHPSKTAPEQK